MNFPVLITVVNFPVLITVVKFPVLITVLVSMLLTTSHCNGLMSPRSHRPAGKARPPVLSSRFSAYLDGHLLGHVLRVPVGINGLVGPAG